MKTNRLLVPVNCTKRRIYLFRPKGELNYSVKFTPPKVINGQRKQWPMRRVVRSTGASEIAAARRTAAHIVTKFWNGDEAQELKLRSDFATIEELAQRYRPRPNDVRPEVATKNRSSFLLVVREVTGHVEAVRADCLTADLAEKFLERREERAATADFVLQERARVSANSTLNQARSVISPKAVRMYAGLKLPDLTGFRQAARLRVDSGHFHYDAEKWALIMQDVEIAAGAELREAQPLLWRAYLLMARLGLRPSEAWSSRRSWIERRLDGSGDFVLMRRPDYVTKTRRYRRVPIEPAVMREFDEALRDLLPEAWIINLSTDTARRDVIQYELNPWLRRFITRAESLQCCRLLRKHAGSRIADRDGIEAAAAFLGDSISVTEKHYVGRLRRARGIEACETETAALRC